MEDPVTAIAEPPTAPVPESAAAPLLASTVPEHGGKSGYQRIAEYLPNVQALTVPKSGGRLLWLASRSARRFSQSRSYQTGSVILEWRVLRRLLFAGAGRPHLVHLLWGNHDLGFLDLLPRTRLRLIATIHNCPDEIPGTFRSPRRLARLDALILMSECQREPLQRLGVPENRLHVVLHGIDTNFFSPGPPAEQTHGSFTILHVGTHRRDFDTLLQVAEHLRDWPNVRFEIVAAPDVHAQFAHLPNVRCFSGLTDEQLRERYRSASCLLQLVRAATANNALLEGMACGLPVVSQRVGGIPEYADKMAFLGSPGDAGAIARVLIDLAADSKRRVVMGASARSRAEALAWNHVAAETSAVYRKVLLLPDGPTLNASTFRDIL